MRVIDPDLDEHLKSGVTTMATCWVLRRSDGHAIGFTDHDRSVELNGVACEPCSGLTGSEIRQSTGFSSDDQDVSGVLSSDSISEADIMSGRFDAATLETWRVNWAAPTQKMLLRSGFLGDIKRDGLAFQAEIRGLSVEFDQERGRIYQQSCDAVFGDDRCGIDATHADWSVTGTVESVKSETTVEILLASRLSEDLFNMGQILFDSGTAKNMKSDILTHQIVDTFDLFELWTPIHPEIKPGDRVTVTVGCDKRFATCRDCFSNQLNFRGFPHIPGNDFILSFPGQDQYRDGSALISED